MIGREKRVLLDVRTSSGSLGSCGILVSWVGVKDRAVCDNVHEITSQIER